MAGLIESFGSDPKNSTKSVTYGTHVEEGTVLARLDSALFKARVDQARGRVAKAKADIEQARAKFRHAERELDRAKKLLARRTIPQQEYDNGPGAPTKSAKATLSLNESELLVAEADLEEATVNLGYTTIRSPVKGIVLDRRINIGQTVVASLNAPSLFLIAKDLSRLEIWSSVNETDIGSIHEGQKVRFTVGTLPHEEFRGKGLEDPTEREHVAERRHIHGGHLGGQLRRAPASLLTARIQFEVEKREHVLLVPSAALRWQSTRTRRGPLEREAFVLALRGNDLKTAKQARRTRPRATTVREFSGSDEATLSSHCTS